MLAVFAVEFGAVQYVQVLLLERYTELQRHALHLQQFPRAQFTGSGRQSGFWVCMYEPCARASHPCAHVNMLCVGDTTQVYILVVCKTLCIHASVWCELTRLGTGAL